MLNTTASFAHPTPPSHLAVNNRPKMRKTTTAYPKREQLHYNERVTAFFDTQEAAGLDMSEWRYLEAKPARAHLPLMMRLAKYLRCTVIDLANEGIGRAHSYEDLDAAVRQMNADHCITATECFD